MRKEELVIEPVRSIEVGVVLARVQPSLVLWAERAGHPVTDDLVARALRQYLKTLENVRKYKRRKRLTAGGREDLNRLNRESTHRLKAERHAKSLAWEKRNANATVHQ